MSATALLRHLGEVAPRRRDPVAILEEQNRHRLADLVALRTARMVESPFAFGRGAAAIMAHDLGRAPTSGVHVLCCGDAHVSNFGFHGATERSLRFDLNDFDEGGVAPWEWDVKRLVTSVHLAAHERSHSDAVATDAARRVARAYRKAIRRLAETTTADRFTTRITPSDLRRLASIRDERRRLIRPAERNQTAPSSRTLDRLVVAGTNGEHRIIDQPPLTRHTDHLRSKDVRQLFDSYRLAAATEEVRYLLSAYEVVDHVLRVVGVRSVGTRCYIVLAVDAAGDPLFLQVKEATPTILATHGGIDQHNPALGLGPDTSDAQRVIVAQRVLQAYPDPFLGWTTGRARDLGKGSTVDYYWRHFRDTRGAVDLARLDVDGLTAAARVCAALLARAHSRSPGWERIAELGASAGKRLDVALAHFAQHYAGVVVADHRALRDAAAAGRVPLTAA